MKKSTFRTMVFLLGLFLGFSGPAHSAMGIEVNENGEVMETSGKGTINWTTRKLEACGIADPDQSVYGQVKAAQIAARAELLAILKGIRIKGRYGVIQGLLRKDISEVEIDGFIVNSYVTKPRTNEWGLIESKAFVYLDRNGNTLLMPDKLVFGTDEETWRPPDIITPSLERHTGLIIDARGLDLKPAMAPKILVEDVLLEVYGGRAADKETALSHGVAAYAGTMQKARTMRERIGQNPLEIKAIGAVNVSDVVISREDALKLARSLKSYDFLKECRVVIVVN